MTRCDRSWPGEHGRACRIRYPCGSSELHDRIGHRHAELDNSDGKRNELALQRHPADHTIGRTIETGIIDVTPASMAGITPGRWLTISPGNADQECVFVIKIDAAAGTFRANFSQTHAFGVNIWCGSMAGRQFRTIRIARFTR